MEATIKTLATKDDIANVKDIANLRKEWESAISDLRKEWAMGISDIRKEICEGNSKLHKEIAKNRTENIKWMFIYSVTQVAAFWFILELLLKK